MSYVYIHIYIYIYIGPSLASSGPRPCRRPSTPWERASRSVVIIIIMILITTPYINNTIRSSTSLSTYMSAAVRRGAS